jgi:tetratricopeptide (TPR) repeat protein
MTIDSKEIQCPNCNKEINISYKSSQYIVNHKTDFSCLGACTSTPFTNTCENCNYVFFDENKKFKEESLSSYIESDKYLELYKEHEDSKPFFIIYNIYKDQGKSQEETNLVLLYNYYKTNEMDDLKLLVDNYDVFLKTNSKKDEVYLFANMLIGEYYRRIGEFEKAKEIFIKVKNIDTLENNYIPMCEFQLNLISEKNMKLEEYYQKLEPDYTVRFQLLDSDTYELPDEADDKTLFYFVKDIHRTGRYSDFRKGLNRLKQMGKNLHSASLASSILFLITRDGGTQAKSEILEMFRIALFEYDVFDIEFDNDEGGTIVDYLKMELFSGWHNCKLDKEMVNTVRDYVYEYILKSFDKDKIKFLSLQEQHILLLTQFPYFYRVNRLMELGCKFDREYNYR